MQAHESWPVGLQQAWPRLLAEAERVGWAWQPHERLQFAMIVAACGWAESGWRIDAEGDHENGVPMAFGIFQTHLRGAGAGRSPDQLKTLEVQLELMIPRFAKAFEMHVADGKSGPELAIAVGHDVERPLGYARGYDHDRHETVTMPNGSVVPRTVYSRAYGERYRQIAASLGMEVGDAQ